MILLPLRMLAWPCPPSPWPANDLAYSGRTEVPWLSFPPIQWRTAF